MLKKYSFLTINVEIPLILINKTFLCLCDKRLCCLCYVSPIAIEEISNGCFGNNKGTNANVS